jgi:hypothetical protein
MRGDPCPGTSASRKWIGARPRGAPGHEGRAGAGQTWPALSSSFRFFLVSIDVIERELVGRDLTVRVHAPLAQEKLKLAFGKARIHVCKWDHVERQVPRREPRGTPICPA